MSGRIAITSSRAIGATRQTVLMVSLLGRYLANRRRKSQAKDGNGDDGSGEQDKGNHGSFLSECGATESKIRRRIG